MRSTSKCRPTTQRWGASSGATADSSTIIEPITKPIAQPLRGTETIPFVSVPLARELRRAGLVWKPGRFDLFHIPDRDLDDDVFVIADLSTEVQVLVDGIAVISFNGAVEWSLDYILTQEVVWLPTEGQARDRLGAALIELTRRPDGFRCSIDAGGERLTFDDHSAADCYGAALLHRLRAGRQDATSRQSG